MFFNVNLIIVVLRSMVVAFKFAITCNNSLKCTLCFKYAGIMGFNLNNLTSKIIIIIFLYISSIVISLILESIRFVALFACTSSYIFLLILSRNF